MARDWSAEHHCHYLIRFLTNVDITVSNQRLTEAPQLTDHVTTDRPCDRPCDNKQRMTILLDSDGLWGNRLPQSLNLRVPLRTLSTKLHKSNSWLHVIISCSLPVCLNKSMGLFGVIVTQEVSAMVIQATWGNDINLFSYLLVMTQNLKELNPLS